MAQFNANGIVRIMSGVPWNKSYKDTRYFSNQTEQLQYFAGKHALYESESNSYIRQGLSYISVDMPIESLWNASYLMFQNRDMGDRWFFAFVDNLEMMAASTTYVYYTIDIMQTWMFDTAPINAYIERRHFGIEQKGDIFVAPENLGTGDGYDVVYRISADSLSQLDIIPVLTSSVDLNKSGGSKEDPVIVGASGSFVNGLPSGCDYYLCGYRNADSIVSVMDSISRYPWVSKGILGCTVIPRDMADSLSVSPAGIGSSTVLKVTGGGTVNKAIWNDNIFSRFPEVKFQKMLMYPFSFIEISNLQGESMIIKPQFVNNGQLILNKTSVFWANPQIKYWVNNYAELGEGYDMSINLASFPQCPVQDNSYVTSISRMEQEKQIATEQSWWQTVMSVLGGVLSANPMASVPQAINTIYSAQRMDLGLAYADTQVPTIRNQGGMAPLNMANNRFGCEMRWKMVNPETQDIINSYWTLYGYSIKQIEKVQPDRMSRFDYVETRNCRIRGNIPNTDLITLQNIYDSGITFWHDDNIGDYSGNEGVR